MLLIGQAVKLVTALDEVLDALLAHKVADPAQETPADDDHRLNLSIISQDETQVGTHGRLSEVVAGVPHFSKRIEGKPSWCLADELQPAAAAAPQIVTEQPTASSPAPSSSELQPGAPAA